MRGRSLFASITTLTCASALAMVAVPASATESATTATCPAVAHHVDASRTGKSCTTLSATPHQKWSVTLDGSVSYPIIAAGKVFVTTANPGGNSGGQLYALDAATGKVVWGPVALSGTYYFFALAYDGGELFTNNFDGTVTAFDPATGAQLWSTATVYFSGEPVATGGVVYVYGSGHVVALSESTGAVNWQASVDGDGGSLAVDGSGVYANGGCSQTHISLTGAVLWNDNDGCTGGGGGTSYLTSSLFFSDTGDHILKKTTGTAVGTFTGTPAFSHGNAFFADGTQLSSEALSNFALRFTTTLPSQIVAGPVIAGNVVYLGSADNKLYGVSTSTGKIVVTLPLPGTPGGGGEYFAPPSDINVGDGLLVVPTGSTVTAFD
ncbi:MAG TPA: PQQ-binding-like beta-propeller repeat protein [Actinocrinis sp.]|uniref:outer membrane protein assembly factor BamB family protein n=1 Tax=Actinocrinis sp. TaxID=1920516 RepID=UPI002D70F2AA|nr:PQQ-binding-like beta-propeller repeat protein [Actinocrinis sp.]HZU58344.1 PQQ-binding-like beta-propeller repeat protein [Actinocrinis sp.]